MMRKWTALHLRGAWVLTRQNVTKRSEHNYYFPGKQQATKKHVSYVSSECKLNRDSNRGKQTSVRNQNKTNESGVG